MDNWFRHSAVDDEVEWEYAQRALCRPSDGGFRAPVLVLAGKIAVAGGDASSRGGVTRRVRLALSESLERIQVISETTDATTTTVDFQALVAAEDEDSALTAINLACRAADAEQATRAGPPIVARVVSLRTKRPRTNQGRQGGID